MPAPAPRLCPAQAGTEPAKSASTAFFLIKKEIKTSPLKNLQVRVSFISSLFFTEKKMQATGEINSKKGSRLENFGFSNQLVRHCMELRRCKSFLVPGLLTVTVHRVHNIETYTCITRVPKQAFSKVNYVPRKRVGTSASAP